MNVDAIFGQTYSLILIVIICGIVFLGNRWSKTQRGFSLWSYKVQISLASLIALGIWVADAEDASIRARHSDRLLAFAKTYALELEHLGLTRLDLKTQPDDPLYLNLIDRQKKWLGANPTIADIYTFAKTDEGAFALLVDSETDYDHNGKIEGDREVRTDIGEIYDEDDPDLELAFSGETIANGTVASDRWGNWMSAYVPVFGSSNQVHSVVGVDYSAEELLTEITSVRRMYFFILAGILSLILVFTAHLRLMQHELLERQKAEKALSDSQISQIRGAKFAALGEMAAGIAHEINNPLAIILMRLNQIQKQIFSEDGLSQEAKSKLLDGINKLESTTLRISKIIKGLRQFSRDGGNDEMSLCSLDSIIHDSLELCHERLRQNEIELRWDFKTSQGIQVKARPVQMSQVLINLISNSYDAIKDQSEKWISIETQIQNGQVQIHITDSGKGIPEDVAEKIMEPFFTTKPVGVGTGLGLSISKGIIEKHGGRFLYDRQHVNTRFTIELPMSEEVPTAAAA